MIHHFVQFALRQRFLVLMLVLLVVVAGALSFQRMPVDAYPDLSPPMVEVITQWPGHAAEEIERLVTLDLQKKLATYPGVIFNYTRPAEDAVDEALTGLKSGLAVKIYGVDLQVLENKAVEIKRILSQIPGFTQLTVVRELGQPTVQVDVDREKIARYGINVSDVEGVIQAGVGGQAATQIIQGERLFDLVVRMKPEYRSSTREIGNLLVPTPSGQQVPILELANIP
jgi:cobalt-zinc-cadmium resistance protein CzcA